MGFKLVGESPFDRVGNSIGPAGDVNGDGQVDFAVAGVGSDTFEGGSGSELYLISGDALSAADAADGTTDGVIALDLVAAQPDSYQVTTEGIWIGGFIFETAGDLDGDGNPEFLIGDPRRGTDSIATGWALVDGDDLAAADAADGTTDGVLFIEGLADEPNSYRFFTRDTFNPDFSDPPTAAATIGDLTGDGVLDLLFSADRSSVYFISGADLAAIDAADGVVDNDIVSTNIEDAPGSFRIFGTGRFGTDLVLTGDLDGDGVGEIVSGAPDFGAVYILDAAELAPADAADSFVDGLVRWDRIAEQDNSYRIDGFQARSQFGWSVADAGDVDGDGVGDILIGAPSQNNGSSFDGAAFLVSGGSVAAADAADGTEDGVVQISTLLTLPGSYMFEGSAGSNAGASVASAHDIDDDGQDDILIGARFEANGTLEGAGAVYIIDEDDFAAADAADGMTDQIIALENVAALPNSYVLRGEAEDDYAGWSVSVAGDLDGNGFHEILIGARDAGPQSVGAVYVFDPTELDAIDGRDGAVDGVIQLANVAFAVLGPTPQSDILSGTEEAEQIDLLTGADLYEALGGNDTVFGSGGNDTVSGDAGDDQIFGGGGNDSLIGGEGNDSIEGGIGFDTMEGGIGADTIRGFDGFDLLNGGGGADLLFGNFGSDVVNGDGGNDTLNGGLGADTLNGGAADDQLDGLNGFDELNGGAGRDTLNGNAGNDRVFGGEGDDALNGGVGFDALSGGAGNDTLFAGDGFDTLRGDAGDDRLEGNAGNDILNGGVGADTMRGGIGADRFEFNLGDGADRIVDFQNNIDSIALDADLFDEANPVAGDITRYVQRTPENHVILDFGDGDALTFAGVTATQSLIDDIVIV
ncbi:calcium-binding protein [Cognatishimia sp. F0-27]|uniref:calcium-binding protein n=1 Tax=Cognatishimia sp. F0-27 TaxID=2816855 RepID=UPI001D0C16CB|nr:hypothetical protein [Cognatishimia sp. F0-27]MCC1494769.1 FG-GAP repeat protein [Cognatishimia sp. F0-27]